MTMNRSDGKFAALIQGLHRNRHDGIFGRAAELAYIRAGAECRAGADQKDHLDGVVRLYLRQDLEQAYAYGVRQGVDRWVVDRQ